jgi:hypothetical protein
MILVEIEIDFTSADGHGRQSTQSSALLVITIESSSLTAAVDPSNPATTELDDPAGAVRPTNQSSRQPTAVTARLSPLSQTQDLSTEGGTPVGPSQDEMSRTLSRAEEVVEGMDAIKAWKGATDVVKQVIDTIGPIADV